MNTDKPNNITSLLYNTFSPRNLRANINNLSYLPRWIIVGIDVMVLVFSFCLTYLLFEGTAIGYLITSHNFYFVAGLIIVNIFFFWLFRTYSGIIRHSSYIDAIKLLFSQMSVLVFFLFINLVFELYTGHKAFLNTALFINLVLSFCGLFLYRVVVKQTFEMYFSEKATTKLVRTVIYGTDANAISVANALKFETPSRFKIVGFVDKNNQNASKRMLDLPILILRKKLPALMRSVAAEGVIIADKSLTKDEQLIIVDQCLEFNYRVYTVPLISDWENQKEISQKVKNIQIEDLLERKPIVLDSRSISKQLKDKTILITGAAGSIGSEIVRQVLNFNPKNLIVLDHAETPLHNLCLETQAMNVGTNIVAVIADVRSKKALEKVFKNYNPHVVFHAAAYKHVPLMEENPSQAIQTNIKGTKNLADLACKYHVKKFVMVSTDKAVNPSNVMGASKRIAEKYVQSLFLKNQRENVEGGTKFITTRFGNVLGSNGSVVPLFTKQIADGGPVTITHQDIIRYFMTIPEACQLVLEAGAMGNGGEIYIFDMGKPVRIIDLARKMIKLAGFIPDKEIKIKIVGLRPGEKLYEELLNDTSKTLPTYHNKIMIAQEIQDEYETLHNDVDELIGIADFYENDDIVAKMKKIVPEFKSMNSAFEVLDK
ncbi:MAG: nucleoside-diphosphate sugar epimerase/dehydratase [Flavobacterium nitrogenifigens]|uniref:NDP-sugar epimerase, includes UDP-GlcNAc-inverting 4,6-dehydratase FlaA1 and capsular polysaccharide biosynthesis protein EpsC n=2 Tax=Flavobacterium nitrogenifigens TaxID=1617283 RepID=A0A521EEY5_9FLAO|nr:nucleoside-diphosphate sugar epimerase/dehydratase [Flavobacterium nitrogenifigens]KAF2325935.1 polysaccharide biosynthesis protein [Flavobacterium nitrogenifigens]MDQ8014888.1 nucleoside-diphosphate sugar epimerase/dehydratase [Flavobacterium nitrogenifigens]SMO82031.1 NDP-sugar epimerase, includes UDP-GlcNAc-inverting 4,6-dehydratase FlaA1 and capsular polysaccharide biosynthesis protein EpsC [Flavobacterium nitrogenifigens]